MRVRQSVLCLVSLRSVSAQSPSYIAPREAFLACQGLFPGDFLPGIG